MNFRTSKTKRNLDRLTYVLKDSRKELQISYKEKNHNITLLKSKLWMPESSDSLFSYHWKKKL